MPKYRITSPDGAQYDVTAPEGASEQDALDHVQQNLAPKEGRFPMPPAANDAEIRQRNIDAGLGPPPTGMPAAPGAQPGMLEPPLQNPGTDQQAIRRGFPGPATPTDLPTGSERPQQAGQPGMQFRPHPPAVFTKPQNPVTLPGRNLFYDMYEPIGHAAEGLAPIYTGLTGLFTQGGRGLYGMVTGEDPILTEQAQQRIGKATSYGTGGDARHYGLGLPPEGVPGTSQGAERAETGAKVLGFPTIPAEHAGQYLTDQGHPGLGTAARIGLDPYTYLPLLGRGGRVEPKPRVEPTMGAEGPPPPPTARTEPAAGPLPQQPPPEFAPVGEGPPMPPAKRTEPPVGKLPDVPGPEFKPVDVTPEQPATGTRIVDEAGQPIEQVPAGKPRIRPKNEPGVSEVYTNERGEKEVSIAETTVGEGEPLPTGDEISTPPAQNVPHETSSPQPNTAPSTTFDLLGSYRKANPDYTPKAYLNVPDSEVRAGGVEGGAGRTVNQSVAFDQPVERLLVEPARLQRLARMERENAAGDPAKAAEYDAQAAQAFEKLQDRMRNLDPAEAERYGALAQQPLTALQRASERYYDQVRGQMLRARESRPNASGVQIRARPYEEHYEPPPAAEPTPAAVPPQDGGPPAPPRAGSTASVADLSKLKPALPMEGEVGEKAGSLARAKEELQAGSTRPVEVTIGPNGPVITDGRHLLQAAQELGIENLPVRVVGGTVKDIAPLSRPDQIAATYAQRSAEAKAEIGRQLEERRSGRDMGGPGGVDRRGAEPPKPTPSGAGGTLSANPIPTDPVKVVRALRDLTGDAGGALGKTTFGKWLTGNKVSRGIKRSQERARQFMNAIQTMPEEAHQPLMSAHDFVRNQEAESFKAYSARRQKGADLEAISENEWNSYREAKAKLHEELLDSGAAVMGGDGLEAIEGYVPIHGRAMEYGPGMYLMIRKDLAPAMRQVLLSRDSTAAGESAVRGVEDVWNTPQTFMMWDPLFHIGTVAGRMAPYALRPTNNFFAKQHRQFMRDTLADTEAYSKLIKDGLQPMKLTYSQREFGHEVGAVEGAGQGTGRLSRAAGATYDAWQAFHQKMPETVNKMQLMFFDMMKTDLIKKGMPEDAAHTVAIRQANNLAGNIPKEEVGRMWGHILKFGVFSKSYTASVIRQVTQSVMQDKLLMAQLERKGYSPADVQKYLKENQDQFTKGLMMDYVTNYLGAQMTNYWRTGANDAPDKNGKKGPHFTWDNPGAEASEKWMPTRVYLNSRNGKDLYMETPFRTTRDMYLWAKQFYQLASGEQPDWMRRKSNPTTRMIGEKVLGETMYGKKLGDRPGAVAHAAAATGPWNELPYAAAEAYREGNMSYLSGYLSSEFDMPEGIFLKILGLQPHTEDTANQDNRKASGEAKGKQDFIWQRAQEVKKNYKNMTPDGQRSAREALKKDAVKSGMTDASGEINALLNYLAREGQSLKSQQRGDVYKQQKAKDN